MKFSAAPLLPNATAGPVVGHFREPMPAPMTGETLLLSALTSSAAGRRAAEQIPQSRAATFRRLANCGMAVLFDDRDALRLTLKETTMRGILLWLIGIPIPIIILLYLFDVL
jgi:hypothetical protein